MAYIIFVASLLVLFAFTRFRPVRLWWHSLRDHGAASWMLLTAFIVPFLGGVQATAAGGIGIPTGIRLVRFFVVILLFLWVASNMIKRMRCFPMAGAAAIFMLLYSIIAMLSALYSVGPVISLWKGFEVFVLVLTGIYLASELKTATDIQWLMDALAFFMLFLVISVLLGVVLAPGEVFVRLTLSSAIVVRGIGPPINPNSLTQFAALLAVFSFINVIDGKARRRVGKGIWIVFGMAVIAMLLGHSRTSIFAGILAAGGVLFFGRHRLLAIVMALGGTLVMLLSEVVESYIYRGQSQDVFLSMSGRTHFWDRAWEVFIQSPIFGHGFYAAQRSLMGVSSVDNTYLEVLLGVGILGLAAFVIPIVLAAFNLLRSRPRKSDSGTMTRLWLQLMTLFVLLFVRSLTGPSFQVMHPNLVMFMVLLIGIAAYRRIRHQAPVAGSTSSIKDDGPVGPARLKNRILRRKSPGSGS